MQQTMAVAPTIFVLLLGASSIQGEFSMPSPGQTDSVVKFNFTCPQNENIEVSYHSHPINCELYYGCSKSNGYVPELHRCPEMQLFSRVYNDCDWQDRTHCGDRQRPEGYSPKASSPDQSTPKPYPCPANEPDSYYADPENCKAYYRCVYGTSYHYICAPPLYFNDVTGKCDWEQFVDCGTRP